MLLKIKTLRNRVEEASSSTFSLIWTMERFISEGSESLISFQLPAPNLCTALFNASSSSPLQIRRTSVVPDGFQKIQEPSILGG